MTGASKTSLLIFVVFARFHALTVKFWQGRSRPQNKEITDHEPVQNYTVEKQESWGPGLFKPRNIVRKEHLHA